MEDTRKPQAGDLIWADRGIYKHCGIYEGGGYVIHFAAPDGSEVNAENAVVHRTTFENFKKNDPVKVVELEGGNNAEETLRRARLCFGTTGYNIATFNCEHFATWCKTGKYCSIQVDEVKTTLKEIFKESETAKPIVELVCNIHDIAEAIKAPKLDTVYPEQENDIEEKIEANTMLSETVVPAPDEEQERHVDYDVIEEEPALENDAYEYNEEDDEPPPPPPAKKAWYEEAGNVIKKLTYPVAAGLEFLKRTKLPFLRAVNFPYLGAKVRNVIDNVVTTIKVFTGRITPEQALEERMNNETALAGSIIAKKQTSPISTVLKTVFGKVGSAVKHIVQQTVTKVLSKPFRNAIKQGARKIGSRIASGVKSFVQKAKQGVKSVVSKVKSFFFG